MEAFEDVIRRGGETALFELQRFFMGEDKVDQALHRIAAKLGELNIPYAIAGGMALNAHGFRRATVDVDVLVTPDGLRKVHEALEGPGSYLNLPTLVELKLASGMTNAGRLKDLGDVQELIRTLGLKRDFAGQLNDYVRGKYTELWDAVETSFDPDR